MTIQRGTRDHTALESRAAADALWMVLAVIQPFKLDAVTLALEGIPGFAGMTVSACRGFGREKLVDEVPGEGNRGESEASAKRHGADVDVIDFTEKVKLEIAVAGRDRADVVIETIARTAHTGNRGDGKIFAWPVAREVRVRTFDEDASAL